MRYDREFALLGLPGIADDAYDVASPDLPGVRGELVLVLIALRVSHHLHLDALPAEVVEDQFGAGPPNGMDATGDTVHLVLERFSVLHDIAEFLDERLQGDRHVKFVRVRVIVRGLELTDSLRTYLKVFLQNAKNTREIKLIRSYTI